MTKAERVLAFVRDHGITAGLMEDGETIRAVHVYTIETGTLHCWEQFPATATAARAWLNY